MTPLYLNLETKMSVNTYFSPCFHLIFIHSSPPPSPFLAANHFARISANGLLRRSPRRDYLVLFRRCFISTINLSRVKYLRWKHIMELSLPRIYINLLNEINEIYGKIRSSPGRGRQNKARRQKRKKCELMIISVRRSFLKWNKDVRHCASITQSLLTDFTA